MGNNVKDFSPTLHCSCACSTASMFTFQSGTANSVNTTIQHHDVIRLHHQHGRLRPGEHIGRSKQGEMM